MILSDRSRKFDKWPDGLELRKGSKISSTT